MSTILLASLLYLGPGQEGDVLVHVDLQRLGRGDLGRAVVVDESVLSC